MKLNIKNNFTESLPADPVLENTRRQVTKACYSFVTPRKTSNPSIIHVSQEMASNLGISEEDLKSQEFLTVFTGNSIIPNTKPYAMCYGGQIRDRIRTAMPGTPAPAGMTRTRASSVAAACRAVGVLRKGNG